jgi:lycopene cyclase domain-containing protein
MSYLTFHLLFILPPIVVMGATLPRPLGEIAGWRARLALPLIAAIAFCYTTPWDNYLVAREVWWYGPERVLATIGFVPVEEYLFFLLQPVLTGLYFFQYLGRSTAGPRPSGPASAWGGFGTFVLLTAAGAGLLLWSDPRGLYMGLVLSWACPLLAGMWLYDGETLWAHRYTLLQTVGVPTLYLWVADATAISTGIWTISSEATLNLEVIGLPIEEATFFLLTNLLVVKGILLLLYGAHDALHPEVIPGG